MFTGIIEEIGTILEIKKDSGSAYIKVEASVVLDGTKLGDSIAIDGACQTVINMTANSFEVFSSYETLNLTTLGSLKKGDKVNLERALRLSDRLGGHIVSGHVDSVAVFRSKELKGEAYEFTFEASGESMRQIAKKGSVTINGISLTVADVKESTFTCAVIPHTIENTTLKYLKNGDKINLETDLLSKYIEKYLSLNDNNSKATTINIDLLERNGFL